MALDILWAPRFTVNRPIAVISPRWFDGGSVHAACAVLAGAAIRCGFGARREPARAS